MTKILILIFLFSSCANFIKRMDKEESNFKILPRIEKTYCQETLINTSVIGPNPESTEEFSNFLKRHRELSAVDVFVLWSLVQVAYHPETNSPTAELKLLFLSTNQKVVDFWHFRPHTNLYPYISGLISILKYYKSKNTLRTLTTLLDNDFTSYATVDDNLQLFLKNNKGGISGNEEFKSIFIRADDILRHKEKFKRISFKKIATLADEQNHTDEFPINPSKINLNNLKDSTILCDFKMDHYEESIYNVQPEIIPSNLFAITYGGTSIIGISSQKVIKYEALAESYMMLGEGKDTTALCFFENKAKNHSLAFIASDSRDPGQHLFHLFKLNLEKVVTPNDLDTLLKFSRHLFLTDPLRLIYESHRGSEKQLTELLKLNIPIYNANHLGNISGLIIDQEKEKSSHHFVLDDRHEGHMSCP